jgi:hypothetical protein
MWNSILSTKGVKFMCLDIKNFYLTAPPDHFEYMIMPLSLFPPWTKEQYNLDKLAKTGLYTLKCAAPYGAFPRQVSWQTNCYANDSSPMDTTSVSIHRVFGDT